VPEISTELGVPSRLTQSILRTLAATRLVSEVVGEEAAFVPARPLDAINACDVLIAMRTGTGQELPVSEAPELAGIYGEFARIEQAERAAAAGVSLLALANRVPPRVTLAAPPNPEPEKTMVAPPVAEEKHEPEPVELKRNEPLLEKMETSEPAAQEEAPRRATARPDEHPDFPL
jgi:DNA-binding IscR family transcriptional regulator